MIWRVRYTDGATTVSYSQASSPLEGRSDVAHGIAPVVKPVNHGAKNQREEDRPAGPVGGSFPS